MKARTTLYSILTALALLVIFSGTSGGKQTPTEKTERMSAEGQKLSPEDDKVLTVAEYVMKESTTTNIVLAQNTLSATLPEGQTYSEADASAIRHIPGVIAAELEREGRTLRVETSEPLERDAALTTTLCTTLDEMHQSTSQANYKPAE